MQRETTRLVIISGQYGKETVATLLEAIIKESGASVARLAVHNDDETKQILHEAQARTDEFTLLELPVEALNGRMLRGVRTDCLVLTSSLEPSVWSHVTVKHLVAPDEVRVKDEEVESYQRVSVGESETADARIEKAVLYRKGSELTLRIDHQTRLEVAMQLTGRANVYNLATAIAAAYVLGIHVGVSQEAVADIDQLEGRFEFLGKNRDAHLFIDRAQDHPSRLLAINSAKELTKRRLIVGLDAQGINDAEFQELTKLVDRVITVGGSGVDNAATEMGMIERTLRAATKEDTILLLTEHISAAQIRSEDN